MSPKFDGRSVRSLNVGFFDDNYTQDAIRSLARADQVTFFTGAGVSADHNIPVWAMLVRSLLEQHMPATMRDEIVDFPGVGGIHLAGAIVSAYFQLPMASAVDQMFEEEYPGRGIDARNREIHKMLYGSGSLTRVFTKKPSMAYDLLRTAITLKACVKSVHIVTTNYDGILEEIAQHDSDIRSMLSDYGLKFTSYGRRAPSTSAENEIPIVHIHGYIPRSGPSRGVVFSEPDYVEWMDDATIRSYLYSRFDHGHTLMLGASLRDYNIITYLRQTRSVSGAHRYALLPLQGDPAPELMQISPEVASMLVAIQESRGRQLGIDILTPDFYGQVRQFLIELSIVAASPTIDTYGQRVRKWRDDFAPVYEDVTSRGAATDALKAHARRLRSWIPEADHIKCELWVRNDVDGRHLELWTESHVVWVSPRDSDYWPHVESITLHSTAPAVVSFRNRTATEGRVLNGRPGRWTHYIAMPIILAEEPRSEIPVGVMVALVNCPAMANDNQLHGANMHLEQIIEDMVATGTALLKC